MLAATLALMLIVSGDEDDQSRASSAPVAEDPDRMICRRAEPVLGSRVARRRICRTVTQWRAFEADRAQLRRDLQNAARDGAIQQ